MKNKYNESIVSSLSNYSIILGISSLIHKRKVNIQEIYNEYGKDYIDAFHNIQKTTANNVFNVEES